MLKIKFMRTEEAKLFPSEYTTIPIIAEAHVTLTNDAKGNFQIKKRRENIIIKNKRKA